jgi:hypothetical protein
LPPVFHDSARHAQRCKSGIVIKQTRFC